MSPALRPYQTKAVADLYRTITLGKRRVCLVARTGTGKTVMVSRIMQDAVLKRHRRVLFLAHRLELVDQASAKLTSFGVPHGVIKEGRVSDYAALCHVACIGSLVGPNAFRPQPDIVVIDEAHRADGDKIAALFPHALKIGLTATPVRTVGSKEISLADQYDALVFIECTYQQLVADGYLVPFKVVAPVTQFVDLSKITVRSGDYRITELSELMCEPKLIGSVVDEWLARANNRATIVFAVDLTHARKLYEAFGAAGINAPVIHGDMGSASRKSHLESLANGTNRVVISVAVLCEGVDIPRVSCIVMARPTRSVSLYLQQIGRGVRPDPGKLDCLVIDHAGNVVMHGPPDMEREWNLDPITKKDSAPISEVPIWRCQSCYGIVSGKKGSSCPHCGAGVSSSSMRRIRWKDGKLIEYDEDELLQLEFDKKQREEAERLSRSERGQQIRRLFGAAFKKGVTSKPKQRRWVFQHMQLFDKSGLAFEDFLRQL